MICIEENSHSLSDFQTCEYRYRYSVIDLLSTPDEKYPFQRGSGVAKYLFYWYTARQKRYTWDKLKRLEWKLLTRMTKDKAFINNEKQEDDTLHIMSRMKGYFEKYRTESYRVIGVEKGFTEVLYENKNVLFTYSGRPDLVVDFGEQGIGPIDHKTESRRSDLTLFQNQFLGYCWATKSRFGMINYVGLQKDSKDNEVLRRVFFSFTDEQIEKWREDTIRWYYRIMYSRINKNYLRSWRCDGKYSVCPYYSLCTSSSQNEEKMRVNRDYVKLEERYRSW